MWGALLSWIMLGLSPLCLWWGWVWLKRRGAWSATPERSPAWLFGVGLGLWLVPMVVGSVAFSTGVPLPSLVGFGAGALAASWVLWHLKLSLKLDQVRAGLLSLLIVLPIVSAASLLSTLVARLMGVQTDALAHTILERIVEGGPEAWGLIAGAVVAAPIAEEVVFRVLLQGAALSVLRERVRGTIAPAAIASGIVGVVFGLIHAGAAPWHALPGLMVLGWCLGMVREARGIWAAIVLHAGFNAWNVVMAVLVAGG